MPALVAPRLEMVADGCAVHAVRFGGDRQLDEFARRELFRRRLISKFEFSHDQDGCIRSLAALALLDTDVLVPGHGDVWRGPIREATNRATALAH